MNLNQLAREITKREGLKQQVNIAQVKEIIRVLGQILGELDIREFRFTWAHVVSAAYPKAKKKKAKSK